MAEENRKLDGILSCSVPEDLRLEIGEEALVGLVFDSLHSAGDGEAGEGSEALAAVPAGQPRINLTLLTYAYAAGIYGSEEIEAMVQGDRTFRYLSARTFPSAGVLRRSRRLHRPILERSLSRVLWKAWEAGQRAKPCLEERIEGSGNGSSCLFDCSAHGRVNEAVLIDTMAWDY